MSSIYCGRLAPSPTGAQHVGNARTYLVAWLRARSQGGRLLLRIEDIDSPRIKPWAAQQAMDDLHWLGLDWDGKPVIQTHRLDHYEAIFQGLQDQELTYPCTCTRKDVERAASAPHEGDQQEPVYPGTCATRAVSDADFITNRPYCWRFRAATAAQQFCESLPGPFDRSSFESMGDFVIWKSSGTPAYQLAVVVDDAEMGITEVVRGDDLVPSTPRQLLLYAAMGRTPPQFFHLPLVVGEDGRRLAKRHGDTRLSSLRKAGVTAQSVLGLLAWSLGWIEEIEPMDLQDLLSLFDVTTIPEEPFVLSRALLQKIGYSP